MNDAIGIENAETESARVSSSPVGVITVEIADATGHIQETSTHGPADVFFNFRSCVAFSLYLPRAHVWFDTVDVSLKQMF